MKRAAPGVPQTPCKQSYIGRDLGEWGLKEYLEVKHIHIPLNNERRTKLWYYVAVLQEF